MIHVTFAKFQGQMEKITENAKIMDFYKEVRVLISTSDFRKGLKVEFKGEPCEIVDFQHV
jgi:hypothetical protein